MEKSKTGFWGAVTEVILVNVGERWGNSGGKVDDGCGEGLEKKWCERYYVYEVNKIM